MLSTSNSTGKNRNYLFPAHGRRMQCFKFNVTVSMDHPILNASCKLFFFVIGALRGYLRSSLKVN